MSEKNTLIIGCGIAGPALAMALQKCDIPATIYESQDATENSSGWFLYVGPNGMNVFKTLGIQDVVRKHGYECKNMVFENHLGMPIAQVDTSNHEKKYGSHGVVIKRSSLHRLLRQELELRGIKIEWNKKLIDINTNNLTTVFFKDDSSAECDCVIGCDGLNSQTRKIIMPDSPAPRYSGNVLAGGISQNQTDAPKSRLSFHYGKKAYMVYFVTPEQEALWGGVIPIPKDSLSDLKFIPYKQWKQKVSKQYKHDASYVSSFIQNGENISQIPLYDIESLPYWYKDNVCLVGDSAHAMTPHAGQGASLALESSIVLAKCMRDIPETQKAFAKYQQLRKPRVEKMVLLARKQGKFSTMQNPMMKWFRAKFLSYMAKHGSSQFDEIYGYRVDWSKKVISEQAKS